MNLTDHPLWPYDSQEAKEEEYDFIIDDADMMFAEHKLESIRM